MDFMNRSTPSQPAHQSSPVPTPASVTSTTGSPKAPKHAEKITQKGGKMLRAGAVALLFALTVLVVSVIGVIFVTNSNDQSKFVTSGSYQAVFLTNGQVYFGKLTEVGRDYFRLNNIYYLTQNTTTDSKGNTTSDGNYTLVKLGCQQIHDPFDEMIIERSQVSFWENLQNGQYSKVVKSISDYQTQSKNKTQAQLCATTSTQTQASNSAATQGGSSAATGTNSGTNSNTKTP